MSSLTDIEKRYLERLLGMQSGYVLDYSDATFGEFFSRHKVNIHGSKYNTYGTSKAKKLRSFWEQESNSLVGNVLSEMLDSYEADCDLNIPAKQGGATVVASVVVPIVFRIENTT